jgi:hypothetical protein
MPCTTEIYELYDKCKFEVSYIDDVQGCKIIGPNNEYIFVPFAGYIEDCVKGRNSFGAFWAGDMIVFEGFATGFCAELGNQERLLLGGDGIPYSAVGISVRAVKDQPKAQQ